MLSLAFFPINNRYVIKQPSIARASTEPARRHASWGRTSLMSSPARRG